MKIYRVSINGNEGTHFFNFKDASAYLESVEEEHYNIVTNHGGDCSENRDENNLLDWFLITDHRDGRKVEGLIETIVVHEELKPRYRWKAVCDDGSWEDQSNQTFATQRDCYEDMRAAVLSKMTWNTGYEDLTDPLTMNDMPDTTCIEYKVLFNKDYIVHSSYSGVYTYRIVKAYAED